MPTPIFEIIIAKLVILTDAVLEIFVNAPTVLNNGTNCTTSLFQSAGLTVCGTNLVGQLGSLISEGVGMLNGLMQGLGVISQS